MFQRFLFLLKTSVSRYKHEHYCDCLHQNYSYPKVSRRTIPNCGTRQFQLAHGNFNLFTAISSEPRGHEVAFSRENATRIFVLRRVRYQEIVQILRTQCDIELSPRTSKKEAEILQSFKKQRRIWFKRTERNCCWNIIDGPGCSMARSQAERCASSQKCGGRTCSRTRSRRSQRKENMRVA